MAKEFLTKWLEESPDDSLPDNVTVLRERSGQRSLAQAALREAVRDHLVGLDIIQSMGGFARAANVVRNALPTTKIMRSGDLGEIIATEYVDQCTQFVVPVRRLRYKDDRSVAMRGDDVLAFDINAAPTRILKTEAKSRVKLSAEVIEDAGESLRRHRGRPNPCTLSFISRRLRECRKHKLAAIVEQLQEADIRQDRVEHLIFTFSGNNPANLLARYTQSPFRRIRRQLIGCVVRDHGKFVAAVFEAAARAEPSHGNG